MFIDWDNHADLDFEMAQGYQACLRFSDWLDFDIKINYHNSKLVKNWHAPGRITVVATFMQPNVLPIELKDVVIDVALANKGFTPLFILAHEISHFILYNFTDYNTQKYGKRPSFFQESCTNALARELIYEFAEGRQLCS